MSWNYAEGTRGQCADCHTLVPKGHLQPSALEVDAPARLVCVDRVWCLRRVKELQEKEGAR